MKVCSYLLRFFCLLVGFIFGASRTLAATSEKTLEEEVRTVGESMVQFLRSENFKKIMIDTFEKPPEFPASAGPGIRAILVRHFKGNGIDVVGRDDQPNVTVKGKYQLIKKDGSFSKPTLVELVVTFTLNDKTGAPIRGFGKNGTSEAKSVDPTDIPNWSGLPIVVPKRGSSDKRHDYAHAALIDAYEKPKANISPEGDEAKRPDSPYGMQLLVKNFPKPLRDQNGYVFCDVLRNEEFELLLRNDSDFDAAVIVMLDGISAFYFSEMRSIDHPARPLYLHYIVPKKSKALVKGWHVDNSKAKAFKVTGYEDSAIAQAYEGSDVGTITASFSAAWETGSEKPPGDIETKNPNSKSGDFIGFGEVKNFSVQAVPRIIGQPQEMICIRYRR